MSENNTTSEGVGLAGLLLVAFIVLKLTHVISWSWWWVLSPAWIPLAIAAICLIVYVILALFASKRK
ncbi:hypothetical protein [Succinimonas sp.]|uniref:hypothetical protein n=1 Tax=Succinimonas sp. TaxID=1936151 RepID=UPI00386BC4DB